METVRKLLKPGSRRRVEALAIVEASVQGSPVQPGEGELNHILRKIRVGESFEQVFPGVSALRFETEGTGPTFNLRISKADGVPITLVKEGEPGASVVAVKRVNELDYYSLGLNDLASKIGLSPLIKVGKVTFKRYSAQALDRLKKELPDLDVARIWAEAVARARRT